MFWCWLVLSQAWGISVVVLVLKDAGTDVAICLTRSDKATGRFNILLCMSGNAASKCWQPCEIKSQKSHQVISLILNNSNRLYSYTELHLGPGTSAVVNFRPSCVSKLDSPLHILECFLRRPSIALYYEDGKPTRFRQLETEVDKWERKLQTGNKSGKGWKL